MNKNIFFVIVLIVSILIPLSCNPLRSYQKREGCTTFFEQLQKEWKYNANTTLFYWATNASEVNNLNNNLIFQKYTSCTKGMSKKEVKKMLGEPSQFFHRGKEYIYYLNDACLISNGLPLIGSAYYLVAKFDKEEKLIKIFYRGMK